MRFLMRSLIVATFGAAGVALWIVNGQLTAGEDATPHLALATLAFSIGIALGLAWRNTGPLATTPSPHQQSSTPMH